jgi:hypothetical protein
LEPIGFAIVRDWASPEQVTLIKPMAVSRPGLGLGRAFLARLADRIFLSDAERLDWLRLIRSENVGSRGIMAQTPPHSRPRSFWLTLPP